VKTKPARPRLRIDPLFALLVLTLVILIFTLGHWSATPSPAAIPESRAAWPVKPN